MNNERWTPVLRGDTYCSPACGHKCTKAAHDHALHKANELAASLGAPWKPYVHENGSWYWGATAVAAEERVINDSTISGPSGIRDDYFVSVVVDGIGQLCNHYENPILGVEELIAEGGTTGAQCAVAIEKAQRKATMTEFEFLKAMYWRLHEFERFLANEKAADTKRKDFINESAVAAIQCSITDYLAMRKS